MCLLPLCTACAATSDLGIREYTPAWLDWRGHAEKRRVWVSGHGDGQIFNIEASRDCNRDKAKHQGGDANVVMKGDPRLQPETAEHVEQIEVEYQT